jgi:hypothetical protein
MHLETILARASDILWGASPEDYLLEGFLRDSGFITDKTIFYGSNITES